MKEISDFILEKTLFEERQEINNSILSYSFCGEKKKRLCSCVSMNAIRDSVLKIYILKICILKKNSILGEARDK